MLRPILPLICLSTLGLAACGDGNVRVSSTRTDRDDEGKGPLKVIDQLQCPQTVGVLTRKATSSEGGPVCVYSGPRGASVSLHLVTLKDGDAAAPLKTFESMLMKGMPAHGQSAGQVMVKADEGADAATVTAPGVDVQAQGDDATVSMPGMRIESRGDKAEVRIGPIHIKADDSTGQDSVSIDAGSESLDVQAHEDGAEVRTKEAGAATRTSWILTDSRGSAEGWKLVGYEARGPEGGPIVVATFKSKDNRSDELTDAVRELVTLNVGK